MLRDLNPSFFFGKYLNPSLLGPNGSIPTCATMLAHANSCTTFQPVKCGLLYISTLAFEEYSTDCIFEYFIAFWLYIYRY